MTVHFSSASISNLFLAAITTVDGIFGSVYDDIIWNALELSMWSMLSLNKENLYHFIEGNHLCQFCSYFSVICKRLKSMFDDEIFVVLIRVYWHFQIIMKSH